MKHTQHWSTQVSDVSSELEGLTTDDKFEEDEAIGCCASANEPDEAIATAQPQKSTTVANAVARVDQHGPNEGEPPCPG